MMDQAVPITHGFGTPDHQMPHQFLVRIPKGRKEPVELWEDFGAAGLGTAVPKLCRTVMPRETWRQVASGVQAYFNRRLKDKRVKCSRFSTGDNRVERLLGRELSVLAWAIENATPVEVTLAYNRWSSHRPEELWWLFQQIDRDGGEWDSPLLGWRLAIRHALIWESEDVPKRPNHPRPLVKHNAPDLFGRK